MGRLKLTAEVGDSGTVSLPLLDNMAVVIDAHRPESEAQTRREVESIVASFVINSEDSGPAVLYTRNRALAARVAETRVDRGDVFWLGSDPVVKAKWPEWSIVDAAVDEPSRVAITRIVSDMADPHGQMAGKASTPNGVARVLLPVLLRTAFRERLSVAQSIEMLNYFTSSTKGVWDRMRERLDLGEPGRRDYATAVLPLGRSERVRAEAARLVADWLGVFQAVHRPAEGFARSAQRFDVASFAKSHDLLVVLGRDARRNERGDIINETQLQNERMIVDSLFMSIGAHARAVRSSRNQRLPITAVLDGYFARPVAGTHRSEIAAGLADAAAHDFLIAAVPRDSVGVAKPSEFVLDGPMGLWRHQRLETRAGLPSNSPQLSMAPRCADLRRDDSGWVLSEPYGHTARVNQIRPRDIDALVSPRLLPSTDSGLARSL